MPAPTTPPEHRGGRSISGRPVAPIAQVTDNVCGAGRVSWPETQRHRLKLLAALRRVNKRLSAWDELDAQALLPTTQRRRVPVPVLDREQLKSLQAELVAALGELETGQTESG